MPEMTADIREDRGFRFDSRDMTGRIWLIKWREST